MRKTNTVILTNDISPFLSIALIQPKVGPRSLGTTFLVIYWIQNEYIIYIVSAIFV